MASRKFFVVNAPGGEDGESAKAVGRLPQDYAAFLAEFGAVRLFREWGLHGYLTGVLSTRLKGPRAISVERRVHQIGFRGQAELCLLRDAVDTPLPLVEVRGDRIVRHFDSFEEWLRAACDWSRKQYSKREWAAVVRGPRPFSEDELRVVEARRQFKWALVDIADDGDCVFQVSNDSTVSLPYLSIGIRCGNPSFEGGVKLPVAHIGPRQSALIKTNCYGMLAPARAMVPFHLADPEPEHRFAYWEFGQPDLERMTEWY